MRVSGRMTLRNGPMFGTILGQWDSETGLKLSQTGMNGYKGNCLFLKGFYGGQGRNRTTDTRIFRLLSDFRAEPGKSRLSLPQQRLTSRNHRLTSGCQVI